MRLVLTAEARADADSAKQLADRVLIECGPEWVNADAIEDLRSWTGIEAGTSFTEWHNLKRLAKSQKRLAESRLGKNIHGKTRGPDHTAGRRAFAVSVAVAEGAPDGAGRSAKGDGTGARSPNPDRDAKSGTGGLDTQRFCGQVRQRKPSPGTGEEPFGIRPDATAPSPAK